MQRRVAEEERERWSCVIWHPYHVFSTL